jgi:hypothetical protein
MSNGTWSGIIAAVKTPLGFFSLVILVLESFLGALAVKSSGSVQVYLVVIFAVVLVLVILIVALTTLYPMHKDEREKLKENDSFAAGLGEEIYVALDGSLSNLSSEERELAYELLRDSMTDSPHATSNVEKHFFLIVAKTIIRKAQLRGRRDATRNSADD